jgi:hypothetical protein
MLAPTVDQSLQNLEGLLNKLDTSLGKNPKFFGLVQAINNAEERIVSTSEDALVTQVLDELDKQLDLVFGDNDYIVPSNGEFKFRFDETLSTAFGTGLPNIQGDF